MITLDKYVVLLKSKIHATSYSDATQKIIAWAQKADSRIVCAANVHMVMEAYDSEEFCQVINSADIVTPDGMPLVWALRGFGEKTQQRVYGPALMLAVCEAAVKSGIPIALYGGSEQSLSDFYAYLKSRFPSILISCMISPPFRTLTAAEDALFTRQIVASGAKIVFVGIGCPKQEYWMARHRDMIPAVMIGVGAAFDFYSGRVKQAPVFLQRYGLEWLFRLCMEPKRLWKRYLKHNPRFVVYVLWQFLRHYTERRVQQ